MATPLAPFPSKGSPAESQAGLLARGSRLLSAPSQGLAPQWPVQISIRLQLRGSDGFAPSSLLTASYCEATWLSSANQLCSDPKAISGVLSREILRCSYTGVSMVNFTASLAPPRSCPTPSYDACPGCAAPRSRGAGAKRPFIFPTKSLACPTRPGRETVFVITVNSRATP